MTSKVDLATFNCSLARTLGIVGDDWSLMILRDAFLGLTRFGEFQQSLGIAKNILADRLERLVRGGILLREGREARPVYRLTERGRDLLPALVALMQWGDRWLSNGAPPMLLSGPDGQALLPVALRTRTGTVSPDRLDIRAGPGADERTRRFLDRGPAG